LPLTALWAHVCEMGTKSRETIYGSSVRAAAEQARAARREADRLACQAWNKRLLGLQGPAQPSPTIGDAFNAGYGYVMKASPPARIVETSRLEPDSVTLTPLTALPPLDSGTPAASRKHRRPYHGVRATAHHELRLLCCYRKR
jgi:hypothetical protein